MTPSPWSGAFFALFFPFGFGKAMTITMLLNKRTAPIRTLHYLSLSANDTWVGGKQQHNKKRGVAQRPLESQPLSFSLSFFFSLHTRISHTGKIRIYRLCLITKPRRRPAAPLLVPLFVRHHRSFPPFLPSFFLSFFLLQRVPTLPLLLSPTHTPSAMMILMVIIPSLGRA